LLDDDVGNIGGVAVALLTIAHIADETVPESLDAFQRLNIATIQGVASPDVKQADALTYLNDIAAEMLPQGYNVDYAGMSRQYVQESSGYILTFSIAQLTIFLALTALFESLREPFITLVSPPMALFGALIFISVGS